MNVPEQLWRYPTLAAIDALTARFGFRDESGMAEWEYGVSDPNRIEEFLDAYESGELTEDERFSLMKTIIESFEETLMGSSEASGQPMTENPLWQRIHALLEKDIAVHIGTVWSWACLGYTLEDSWWVAPSMRKILITSPPSVRENTMSPIDWNAVLSQKIFWMSYFGMEGREWDPTDMWLKAFELYQPYDPQEEDPDTSGLPDEIVLTVPVTDEFSLEWALDSGSGHELFLIHRSWGRIALGETSGHFHLDTFRWEERELILQHARARWDERFEFHFLPVLLMMYLGPVPTDNIPENIAQLADELNNLSVFSESEIEHFSTASFACRENARWEFDAEKGWCHYNGYSTRDGELGTPEVFAAMRAFLAELEQPPPA